MNGISTSYNSAVYPPKYTYSSDNAQNPQSDKPQMLVERKLGAVKMPKASTLRAFFEKVEVKFEQWLNRYNSRPHRYNTDRWKDTADLIIASADNKNDKRRPNQPAALSLRG